MEFKSLKNIESSFRQIRAMAMLFVVLCSITTLYVTWKAYDFAEEQRQKIYILDNGKSLIMALSQDLSQNRPIEGRSHVKLFHELFFTLSPDKNAIESNLQRSLYMADKSAYNYYKDLSEKGYFNRVISGNIHQQIAVDSMQCNFDSYPYEIITYARQMIIRESNITERSLITRCHLINAVRSENNPHGFTLENLEILRNEDMRIIKR